MEYHLEHRVRLKQDSEHKSLYTWSLQEISQTGEEIGLDQVPWEWSLYFTASELRYNKELSIERESDSKDIVPTSEGVLSTESISAVLRSGATTANGVFEREAIYSMFGTDRQIQNFSLIIRPLEGDEPKDVCVVWGCVSYSSEIDFRTETEDDIVQVSVGTSPERFKELRELVNHVHPDMFVVRLGGVAGFYSEWSPSVSTDRIKVLTRGSEHKVEVPEGCEVEPPRLGEVDKFELTAVRRRTLQLGHETEPWDEEDELEDIEDDQTVEPEPSRSALDEPVVRNQATPNSLKWPMWLIVVLLILLYLK